ncbi:MAG: HAD family phosphatase [Caldiserica bacterium]|nr:HAD family phosphatase [Caldisericota bacterium]
MNIRAIIFDGDGVLFDSEKVHVKAWEQVFEKIGVKLSLQDYEVGTGNADREFLEILVQRGKIPARCSIEAILKEKFNILMSLSHEVNLFPGVKEILKSLAPGYALALASNSRREFVLKVLKQFALTGYFEKIITKENVRYPKPSPEIYLLAARELGVNPAECVVIEDSVVGIEAAKKAGAVCLAVTHTFPVYSLGKADAVLPVLSREEIEKAIARLAMCPSYV